VEEGCLTRFEFAQLTIQGVGVVAVILTLYVYYRQLRTMNAQRQALEREMAARLRPWVGLFGFGFEAAAHPKHQSTLRLLLRNCGALPAQRAQLSLSLQCVKSEGDGSDSPIHWQEVSVKALVPGEDGNYGIDVSKYPQFSRWREARYDVLIQGSMTYSLEQASFRTKFEAALRFSEDPDPEGRVKTRWRNVEVI
jgi:hypothetical protein